MQSVKTNNPLEHLADVDESAETLAHLISQQDTDTVVITISPLNTVDFSRGHLKRIAEEATKLLQREEIKHKMRVVYIPEMMWFMAISHAFVRLSEARVWPHDS